jgi:hypothetical protein
LSPSSLLSSALLPRGLSRLASASLSRWLRIFGDILILVVSLRVFSEHGDSPFFLCADFILHFPNFEYLVRFPLFFVAASQHLSSLCLLLLGSSAILLSVSHCIVSLLEILFSECHLVAPWNCGFPVRSSAWVSSRPTPPPHFPTAPPLPHCRGSPWICPRTVASLSIITIDLFLSRGMV